MKEKKLTIIASATLAIVLCISAVIFFAGLSQDDLPDCTYKITKEQREMSTYDLLKWFCETDYAKETSSLRTSMLIAMADYDTLPKLDDHQAYYELLSREDIREVCAEYYEDKDCPDALITFCVGEGWFDVLGIDLSEVE